MNQADEVERIQHGRELAADSVPDKKESAIEHGDENAIETPRNYNVYSADGNSPLNSVSQSRGAPPLCPLLSYVEARLIPSCRPCRHAVDCRIVYSEARICSCTAKTSPQRSQKQPVLRVLTSRAGCFCFQRRRCSIATMSAIAPTSVPVMALE